ncbi:cytochrome C, partial [bacterium]|nr:cytochrome C [bacterium]
KFAIKPTLMTIILASSVIAVSSPLCSAAPQDNGAKQPDSTLDSDGHLVQFERDIAPILLKRCLECHGPDDAKNDFRVDDRELMLDYIEPGDAADSMLFVDYMTTDDEDMLMPPKSHGGPCSVTELALIQVWINEGANWPEGDTVSDQSTPAKIAPPKARSLPERIWFAQGFLHPATVHFPIALFTLGAGFVVLSVKWPALGKQIPLACLLLGALSSIAATLMGWALAPEQGYGSHWHILEWGREVDAHRLSAVVVTVFSTALAIIALVAIWKDSQRLTKIWKVGLLICAGMVGAVGHQGGEMSYGKDFYPRALRILTGAPVDPQPESPKLESEPAAENASAKPNQADASKQKG